MPISQSNLPLPTTTKRGAMLYRKFGSTDEEISLIGLGGFHIGVQKEEADSLRLIRAAIDRGINFLDNCWDYNDGLSEIRMGKALQNGYRDKVFLMTKIDGRDQKTAANQIDESLLRLQTDRIDLMQFHEVIRLEDPDRIFAKNGAAVAMREAQKAGKIRYIGFTGHKDPLVHLRMLDIARENGMHFDAVQMPINVLDAHFRSFQNHVLPRLVEEKIAPLAMKTFGNPFILERLQKTGAATALEMLHYSMSLPVATVITGIEKNEILEQALRAVKTFEPMSQKQQTALLERIKTDAQSGQYEKFKSSAEFDGTAKNPQWLSGSA